MKKRNLTRLDHSKSQKEGTLEEFAFSSDKGDDFDETFALVTKVSICGLPDFIAKARDIAKRMTEAPGSIRARRAASLHRDLERIEAAVRNGIDSNVLYSAVGAALTYANLRHEENDDAKSRGKITRQKYLKLKSMELLHKEIAAELGVTPSKLTEWKRRHLRA